jgi:hypothetical protein
MRHRKRWLRPSGCWPKWRIALGDALLADTAERIAQARASADGREGIAAFLAKRKPNWIDPEAR